MLPVVTAEQMRTIDQWAIKEIGIPGIVLMENAGKAIVKRLQKISKREVTYKQIEYPASYPADEPMRRCPDIQKARLQLNFNREIFKSL